MASIKKKSSGGGGGANWMDTYGDMVTLLLCFFVLLYSISTIDQTKWMLIVQSFNRAAIVNPNDDPPGPVGSETGSGGDGLPATDMEEALNELYEYLKVNVASDDVTVSKGDGYVFISFAETVFFSPNSSALRQEGKEILDTMLPALRQCAPNIDELQVLGNTSQAYDDRENKTVFDRQLASLRATEVVIYLQDNISRDLLNPGRLVPIGYGQWRNKVPNDTPEGKAENRRVEMVITGQDLDDVLSSNYQKYSTMLHSTGSVDVPD